ncbi:MAG TPA: FAD-binding oxidoreductase [Rhodocyclaceae bacterium]|jgi:FAD/FMN-containing dehydrogenase|nr:FAD-binding oxidoreductase [Rhodocyclaceae bacterium]
MPRLIDSLSAIVGPEHVLKSHDDVEPYLNDWRRRYHGSAQCVVRPGSATEVAAIVAACSQAGIGVVPLGGNTGLVGGGVPKNDEVVVSLERMNRIRHVDADNNTITVEAGCILQNVQEAAERVNRLFPLSLAAEGSATIGGNISTNAGGVQVLRYGNMRDLVLGLEVVLPDGRLWNGLRALRKDNTGYDLKHLFIGAEGSLGLVTAAVLKLFPRPQAQLTAWLAVPSPQAAVAVLSRLREHCGERVTAFEVMGRSALELVAKHLPQVHLPMAATYEWQVLLELNDTWAAAPLQDMLTEVLEPLLAQGDVLDAVLASSVAQSRQLWQVRENIPEAQKIEGFSIKHDISMPISAIAPFIEQAKVALEKSFPNLRIVCFGHAGDGNLHYNLSTPVGDGAVFMQNTETINHIVHDLAHGFGGSISAEHGIGQLKKHELVRYKSKLEMDLMHTIKDSLDPQKVLNPGKLFIE